MSTPKRVAVVTGSNKGLGFAIVRGLCKSFDGDVLLTARDEGRGHAAVQSLESEGFKPKFHQLDITDHNSIINLHDFLQKEYGGLDVLVNNAAVLYLVDPPESMAKQAKHTIDVNYFANLDVCQVLFPLLRPHARVLNMSSGLGRAAYVLLPTETKQKLTNPDISIQELCAIMSRYSDSVQAGKMDEEGFTMNADGPLVGDLPPVKSNNGVGAYGMSKIGMNVMTMIHQREMDKQGSDDILINCCSPGYVNTDMTHGKGTLSADEGAVTPLYCCLLPNKSEGPRGLFIRNKAVENWSRE